MVTSIANSLLSLLIDILMPLRGVFIRYNDTSRARIFKTVRAIIKKYGTLLRQSEGMQLYMGVKNTSKIKGDIAEVGVYKGGSAKIICLAKGKKTLHLFDTFEGLPNPTKVDRNIYKQEEFQESIGVIKRIFIHETNVKIYKGLFPDETGRYVYKKKFSFVNLDVDLYRSTFSCLRWFYSRMTPGGIIMSHDYSTLPGVKAAFDEFFRDKPEPIIEMSGSQCLIVKI